MRERIKAFIVVVALIPILLLGWVVTLILGDGWEEL